jgi:hypothetical protein
MFGVTALFSDAMKLTSEKVGTTWLFYSLF